MLEIIKSRDEDELTEEFIEEVVDELKEQEAQEEPIWDDEQDFEDEQGFGGMSM